MAAPPRIDPIAEARRHWVVRWGERPARPMAAVTSLMRAQQILLGRLNAELEPEGLTFARYECLMLLSFSREGELPMGKVGERLQVHRTSVTNLVDKLEQDGLVRRRRHETDGRTTLAAITDRGREVAERATGRLHDVDFGMGALADEAVDRLTEDLRALRADAGDLDDSFHDAAGA